MPEPVLRWSDYALDTDEEAVRTRFATLLDQECSLDRVRAAEPLGFDDKLWRQLVELGALALRGMVDVVLAAEEHGRHLAPVPFVESVVAARVLARHGDGAAVLDDVVSSGKVVTIALHAVPSGEEQLVPAAPVADVVVGLDGDELVAVAGRERPPPLANLGRVPLGRGSLAAGERTVLACGDAAVTGFTLARREWQLGTAAALVGLGAGVLAIAAVHARERHQFGVPIGSFQAIAHPLADAGIVVDAGRRLARKAAWFADHEPDGAPRLAVAAFLHACEAAARATQVSAHTLGGSGLTTDSPIEPYFRRAKGWAVLGGDPRAELLTLADLEFGAVDRARRTVHVNFSRVELDDDLRALQTEVRAFCEQYVTDAVRDAARRRGDGHSPEISRALGARGWLYPHWPVERGGAGLDALHTIVLNFELARANPPRSSRNTTAIVVGAIEAFGTDEMKAAVLPGVTRGETTMCLAWTEPGSGTDIAAASCRAERNGDEWVVNGQKFFITGAHFCTYAFLLTRTNPGVPKHRGLTMFLVPLDSPGITVDPVMTYSDERANVVTLRDVRVHDRWRIGAVDDGWRVLSNPLGQEHGEDGTMTFRRDVIGYTSQLGQALEDAVEWARTTVRADGSRPIDDPVVRMRLARAALACIVGPEAPVGPMRRVLGSDLLVELSGDLVDLVGPDALLERDEAGAVGGGEIDLAYRTGPATTIYGGTTDIHRSVIAERLGLPKSR